MMDKEIMRFTLNFGRFMKHDPHMTTTPSLRKTLTGTSTGQPLDGALCFVKEKKEGPH